MSNSLSSSKEISMLNEHKKYEMTKTLRHNINGILEVWFFSTNHPISIFTYSNSFSILI